MYTALFVASGPAVLHYVPMTPTFPADRAYSYVDRGRALLGNPWLERRWSAFLGTTNGLWHKPPACVWSNVPGDELAAPVDGAMQPAMAFGEVAWSEEANPYGATLVQTRTGLGLTVEVRTLAFHAAPAMVRTATLIHRQTPPQDGWMLVDELRLGVTGGEASAPRPASMRSTPLGEDIGAVIALERPGSGLLMAAGADGRVEADLQGDPHVRFAGRLTPQPRGQRSVAPFALLAFYAGTAGREGVAVMRKTMDLWREYLEYTNRRSAGIEQEGTSDIP